MNIYFRNNLKTQIKIVLSIIILLATCARAQNPGYMGKKVTAGYGFYFNPAFASVVGGYGNNPVNTLHEFFIERATSKKFVIGFSAKLYRYEYNNVDLVNVNGYYNYYSSQTEDHPEGSYKIKGRNFQLYGKFFMGKYVAPWGKYFMLGLSLNNYKTIYDPDYMKIQIMNQNYYYNQNYASAVSYLSDFGPTVQSFQNVDICFGHGNSRILGNRIVLDYGYNFNFIAMTRILLFGLEDVQGYSTQEYIEKTSTKRVAAINRFNFYLKLGYLF